MAVEYSVATQNHPPGESMPKELNAPGKLSSKPDFLAAYGLELDDDDEEEEDAEEDASTGHPTSFGGRLIKKKQKKPSLLTKSLVAPRRQSDASSVSPSSSPRAHARRTSLVGLVRSKSPSSATGEPIVKTAVLPSPTTILAKREIDYGRSPRQHSMSSPDTSIAHAAAAASGPTVQFGASRRGHTRDEASEEEGESLIDDASSASHYPPSVSIAHDGDNPMTEARAPSLASSHMQASDIDAAFVGGEGSLPDLKADDTASSFNDGAESWESGGVKTGGFIAPPALPARTPGKPTTAVSIVTASPPPPALPPRRRVSRGEESAEAKSETVKESKEESKRLAAERKASIAEEKLDKEKRESKARREARERKILLKTYEELEVERFLGDFGKHVRQVHSTGFIDSAGGTHAWPEKDDWRYRETGKLNVAGFAFAYVLSFFSYLSPTRFVDIQGAPSTPAAEDFPEFIPEEQNFRIAALRANAERLYLTALPMYEGLFTKARRIWRWDSIFRTSIWCSSYFMFWYRGMLLPALFALIIWTVLRVRAYPPKPETLRAMLVKQQTRTKELDQARKAKAEDIIRQAQEEPEVHKPGLSSVPATKKKKGRYGLAADATRRYGKMATLLTSALADVHERIKNFVMWRSVPATWRALTLLFLSMLITFFSTPWMVARFPGLVLGVSFFFVAPIAEHRPEWMGVEWKNPFDFLLAGVPSDAQHAMQVLRRRAASGDALTGDEDVIKWIRGGGDDGDDDDADTWDGNSENGLSDLMPSLPALEGAPGAAAVSSAVDRAAVGGSAAVDWKKWRARMNKGREMAVMGSEMLSGQRPVELPRLGGSGGVGAASTTAPTTMPAQESTMTSRMLAGMTSGINWGLDSLESTSNRKLLERGLDADEVRSASDGVYWAVHLGSCGHVVVTPERIRFRSFFARKKPTNGESTAKQEGDDQTPVLDPLTGKCLVDEKQLEQVTVRTLVDVRLESVVQLKKTRSVNVPGVCGIDGLEIRSRGGKVYQFSSIVKRDEAFNRILALAPQNWNKM